MPRRPRRTATYRRGRYRWPVIVVPWGRYARSVHLFWRIRILLWLALGGGGLALAGAGGLAGGVLAAWVAEAAFSYRRQAGTAADSPPAAAAVAAQAQERRTGQLWRTMAVPSPGGWVPPPGSRPGWQWAPPDGLVPRLDRVPAWVRLWYRTPFADRYAHAWMWEHGGWDTLPPGTSA
jgi:hypothetical protein